jgi:hypothetical protein
MLKRKRKDDDDVDDEKKKTLSTEEHQWVARWRNLEIKNPLDDLKSEFYVMYGSTLSQIKCLALSMFDLIIGYLEPIIVIILKSGSCLAIDLFADRELSILQWVCNTVSSMRMEIHDHCNGGLVMYDSPRSTMHFLDRPQCKWPNHSTPSSGTTYHTYLAVPHIEREMTKVGHQFDFSHYIPIANADKTNPLAVTTYWTKSLLFIDQQKIPCVGTILKTWSSDEGRTLNVLTLVQHQQLWWSRPFSTKTNEQDKTIDSYVIPNTDSYVIPIMPHIRRSIPYSVIPYSDGNEIIVWSRITKPTSKYKDYRIVWKRGGSIHLSQSEWGSQFDLSETGGLWLGTSSHQSRTNCCPSIDHPIISIASLMHSNFSIPGFLRFPFMRIRLYRLCLDENGSMNLKDEIGRSIQICRSSKFELARAFTKPISLATDFMTCGLQISEYSPLDF